MRRTAIAAGVLVCLWFARGPLLRGLARVLIVDQWNEQADYLLLFGGDHCFDMAAHWYHEEPSRMILLVESRPERLVRTGVLPSTEETCLRELESRAVPRRAVEVIPGEAAHVSEAAELLGEWLHQRPDARVQVLCERFDSRRCRLHLDAALRPADAARVSVRGLPDRRYDETDWWTSRRGFKEFGLKALALGYSWSADKDGTDTEPWDPDEYERSLPAAADTADGAVAVSHGKPSSATRALVEQPR